MEQLQSHICMRKGFLIYEEIRRYSTIYEEAVSHLRLCNCSISKLYEENLIFFFVSVQSLFYGCVKPKAVLV
jgi:hypothetical protein